MKKLEVIASQPVAPVAKVRKAKVVVAAKPDIEMAPPAVVLKATRTRKAKAVIVVPVKKVYPIQIRHLASPVQPKGKKALVGSDTKTLCGRVVVKQMTRVAYPLSGRTVAECPECSANSHENNAFEIVRSAASKAKKA